MDHSGDADDVSGITWPGFVDIMSSVIMMFIFFVLITSVALYFHTITYKSKVLAQVQSLSKVEAQKQTQDIVKENIEVKKKLQEVVTENKKLEETISQMQDATKKNDSKFANSKEQQVEVDETAASLTLFFGQDSISLTEESKKTYENFLKKFTDKGDPTKVYVEINASKDLGRGAEFLSQEISTSRLMNTRNIVLKTKIPKDHVTINISKADEKIGGKGNWVTVKLRQK